MSRLTPSVSFNVTAMMSLDDLMLVAFPIGKPVSTFPGNALCVWNQRERCARAPVAPVVDPADAGHERVRGVLDLTLVGLTHQLAHRLDQIVRRAGRLARPDLSPAGVERQRAAVGQIGVAHEWDPFARLAEAQRLELNDDGDEEIVVGVEGADVLDAEAGICEGLLAGN